MIPQPSARLHGMILKIDWQLTASPTISAKDSSGVSFREAEVFA